MVMYCLSQLQFSAVDNFFRSCKPFRSWNHFWNKLCWKAGSQQAMSREIRASYTDTTVRVYQAFNDKIADAALEANRFVPPFIIGRMTWIKPSFCWMAYRSGYSYKDVNQQRILAIDLHRDAFEKILSAAVVSGSGSGREKNSDVVVQWDPERDVSIRRIGGVRSIQIGMRKSINQQYADGEFIHKITDVTDLFREVHRLVEAGCIDEANAIRPVEQEYQLTPELGRILQVEVTTDE